MTYFQFVKDYLELKKQQISSLYTHRKISVKIVCSLQILVYFEMCPITKYKWHELIQTPRKQILLSGRVVQLCFILLVLHSFFLFGLIFFFEYTLLHRH